MQWNQQQQQPQQQYAAHQPAFNSPNQMINSSSQQTRMPQHHMQYQQQQQQTPVVNPQMPQPMVAVKQEFPYQNMQQQPTHSNATMMPNQTAHTNPNIQQMYGQAQQQPTTNQIYNNLTNTMIDQQMNYGAYDQLQQQNQMPTQSMPVQQQIVTQQNQQGHYQPTSQTVSIQLVLCKINATAGD